MSKDEKKRVGYLGAHVPGEKKKRSSSSGSTEAREDYTGLRMRLDELNEQMIKQNRDRLDAEYNVDFDNLSEDVREQIEEVRDVAAEIARTRAEFNTYKTDTTAQFQAIAEWQGETDSAIAEIAGEVGDGWAKTSMFASLIDAQGNVTAASIVAAVNGEGSSVLIDADKIRMTGTTTFLTADDVGDGGSTEIAGNRISLNIPGGDDDGHTTLYSDNGINFEYDNGGTVYDFARVYTDIDGSTTDLTSRYALNISTSSFRNAYGGIAEPSIKIQADGRVSISGDYGVYLSALRNDAYITANAGGNTRIRANKSYSDMTPPPSSSDWSFCTDGIYFGGVRVVAV